MVDAFISYSKPDAVHTETLSSYLEAHGLTTWWDTGLLPEDEFSVLIKKKIEESKAVVVIWTTHSVRSTWVKAEAALARELGKLVTLCTPSLEFRSIPMPYNALHCESIENRGKVLAAIKKLTAAEKRNPSETQLVISTLGDELNHNQSMADRLYRGAVESFQATELSYDLLYNPNYVLTPPLLKPTLIDTLRTAERIKLAQAVSNLEKAARLGFKDACLRLGWLCERGYLVKKDLRRRAVDWYQKAASLGDAEAPEILQRFELRRGG